MSQQIRVVSSFHASAWHLYGQRFLDSFTMFWPKEVRLELYLEKINPKDLNHYKRKFPNLQLYKIENIQWLSDFLIRNEKDPYKNGYHHGDNYKMIYDAIKFSKKTAAIIDSATSTRQPDLMFWLDADTVTHSPISMDFLFELMPQKVYTCYLGREQNKRPMYSECGFVGYNLNHPINSFFMSQWKRYYEMDNLFSLKEWHDSYVYDYLRKHLLQPWEYHSWTKHLKSATLHPFIQVFGQKMDHLKGPIRKQRGHSDNYELVVKNDSPYWN